MSNRKKYHVVPTENGDWALKLEGASKASAIFDNKDEAIRRGRELARAGGLGQLIIHGQNGRIQTEHTYGEDPYPPKG